MNSLPYYQITFQPKNSGIFAPFFGQPAYTMTLAHQLIKRTKCKVIIGLEIRVKQGFELNYEAPEIAIYDSEGKVSVAALNRLIEKVVNRHISQYQWGYKRFKRRPEWTTATPYMNPLKGKTVLMLRRCTTAIKPQAFTITFLINN